MCGMFTLTVTDTETETNTNTDEMGVATNGNLCLPSVSVQCEHLHIILHTQVILYQYLYRSWFKHTIIAMVSQYTSSVCPNLNQQMV